MKFNIAWSEVLSQNTALRFTTLCLSLSIIGLLIVIAKLSLKDAIVIERACFSQALEKVSPEHTENEILAFMKEALSQRFDSGTVVQEGYLSTEELLFREQEQKDLAAKEMKQKVIVNRIQKVEGQDTLIDSDRLFSIGPVRSALPFPLKLTIASTRRTNGNPYGLKVLQIKPVQSEKKDGK